MSKIIGMNIAVKKVELIEWLAKLEDKTLLEQVDNLKKKAIKETYLAKMKPMTSTEYSTMLDQAEKDLENGKFTSSEDLEKESSHW